MKYKTKMSMLAQQQTPAGSKVQLALPPAY